MENYKEKIEKLRELLHEAIDKGNSSEIISISQEMDKLLLEYIKELNQISK